MKTHQATRVGSVLISLVAFTLMGCSASSADSDATATLPSSTSPSATEQTTTTTASSPTTTTTVAVTTTTLPGTTTTLNANPFGGNDPEDFLMPDVVCMTLQQAQDEIQDHGVFFSRSEDATGQRRMQLNDSNWIVVKQSPKPGTKIAEGDPMLSAVKIGEPTGGLCK